MVGKYKNLIKLRQAGFNVPTFEFIDSINNIEFIDIKKNTPYILRSCFSYEDGKKYSFAGIFESFYPLYSKLEISNSYKNISHTLETFEYKNYLNLHNIKETKGKIGAILQEYIIGDFSGVCFTENNSHIRIEIIPGLNFPLLDGKIRQPFWIEASKLGEFNISNLGFYGEKKFSYLQDNKLTEVDFCTYNFEENIILKSLKDMIKIFLQIEEIFGIPQDIEFTHKDGILYILQTRAITV